MVESESVDLHGRREETREAQVLHHKRFYLHILPNHKENIVFALFTIIAASKDTTCFYIDFLKLQEVVYLSLIQAENSKIDKSQQIFSCVLMLLQAG